MGVGMGGILGEEEGRKGGGGRMRGLRGGSCMILVAVLGVEEEEEAGWMGMGKAWAVLGRR